MVFSFVMPICLHVRVVVLSAAPRPPGAWPKLRRRGPGAARCGGGGPVRGGIRHRGGVAGSCRVRAGVGVGGDSSLSPRDRLYVGGAENMHALILHLSERWMRPGGA